MEVHEQKLIKTIVNAIDKLVIYLESQDDPKAKNIDRIGMKLISAMWEGK